MDLILHRGGNVDIGDWIGDTPAMFCAYKAKDPVTMEWLMDHGASLFPVSRRSGNLLQCAAMEGDPDVLEVILRKKPLNVSPDIGVDHNYNEIADLATPLQCAAYAGNLACIELLLKYDANVNLAKGKVGTALHAAGASGNLEAFRLLLERGANPNVVNGQYGSVLWAAAYGGDRECVRICLQRGLSIDENAGDRYCRDIFDAARSGMTSRVKAYLDGAEDRKAELEKKHEIHMRTPLSWAAAGGHIETVKYLAMEGANLNVWGRGLETPLEFGCLAGRLDMVKCLLALGARAEFRQAGKYRTAVVCAEMSGNKELVEFLKALEEDRTVTFEFEGQTYEHDGDKGYKRKQ
ncbi:ankyrin repeat-containing domain protein [Colletotrichum lupini]|nr:ankyrin repeat-containing domain protein [Colletotrichum lupini]